MTLHTYTRNQGPYQVSTSYTIHFLRYSPGQDFQTQGHYSKVKSQIKVRPWRSTPLPLNQCPYQVSTSYTPADPDTMGENNTLTAH